MARQLPALAIIAGMLVLPAGKGAFSADWSERPLATGTLQGTLAMPVGEREVVAVLILPGSGPVDRDGNTSAFRNDSLKLLARSLAAEGIATLRIDKRGVGGSAGDVREGDLRFGTYVDDALAWLDALRVEPRVSRVAVIGHSEGALVGTLAAQRTDLAALVLLAGAGEPAGQVIARQLEAAGVPADLRAEAARIATQLLEGKTVDRVPYALQALYRPSVQSYLMSWFALDPAAELGRVRCPVLIVQGTADVQIAVGDADRLAAARPGSERLTIEGMNHVLRIAPTERSANLGTYGNPDLPLAPELVPGIAAFLKRH